ncbi:FAA hydrolase family protein [Mesorhizobium waimense]|uniref:FAA hydrolase family protein n=1 Tax=Mesorhizobium waimense TaxID=1300307 RepID=A0A3A5JTN5_9HYPH|nr:fumarylacetoacetate hydrolase family protein [Mesorhizobium waimense]RJT26113.1 FAA hydrolase family protein [Mesorhizobium waimense]
MKYLSFFASGLPTWGVVSGDYALAIGLVDGAPSTLRQAMSDKSDLASLGALAPRLPLADIEYLPVIPDPDKIICVGLNYEEHRKETGRAVVGHPTLFTRFANVQVGQGRPLLRPKESIEFDYEGELALVIGKGGRSIRKEDALSHIAGYACYNDGSIRDWQRHTSQFVPGKNFIGTGAFGPWLVTPDEVGPLDNLQIETRLNGETVQKSTLGHMIFDIPTIIAYCSTFTRLEVGDVIVTGTPGGVGMKREPPLWMKAGDVVEVEIDRVGLLRNPVEDAA